MNVRQYFRDVRTEMKKVTWPGKDEVRGSTFVVIVTVIIFTIFIGVADKILSEILKILVR